MEDSLNRLNGEQKKLTMCVIGLAVVLLGAFGTALLKHMQLSLALMVCALLYQLIFYRKMRNRYEKMVNDENLRWTVCRVLKDSTLDPDGGAGLKPEIVEQAHLLPHFTAGVSTFGAFKGVSGRDGKTKVIAADVALNDSFRKGGGTRKPILNCGCFVHLDFSEDEARRKADFRVLTDGPLFAYLGEDFEAKYPEYKRVPQASSGLPDTLRLYVPENAGAGEEMGLPGEDFLRKLRNLADYTPAELWISVRQGHMDVYLRDRFLAMPVNDRKPLVKEVLLLDPLPELKRILDLAESV